MAVIINIPLGIQAARENPGMIIGDDDNIPGYGVRIVAHPDNTDVFTFVIIDQARAALSGVIRWNAISAEQVTELMMVIIAKSEADNPPEPIDGQDAIAAEAEAYLASL